jgi:hypothetical protein
MLKGYVSQPEDVINRGICYCKDCRDYAHVLGKAAETLDSSGGTEVVAVSPKNVVFTQGIEKLSCLSLSEKGLLRWYASCCNTPIGNTPRNFKVSFVGLVHNCLEQSEQTIVQSFGPVKMWVNTHGAKGKVNAKAGSTFMAIMRVMKVLLLSRLSGSYKTTPFFVAESGSPIKVPRIVSSAERVESANAG